MVAATEKLCSLLVQSHLLSAEEVQRLGQRWRGEAGTKAEDGESFAKWLVGQQLLTRYQAALLLRGHADHFFLDQYKLLERIGTGRMAGVFKAVHRLGQTVAIKVLPPSKAKVEECFGRFQREARISVRLRHPNTVRTFQLCEAAGLHYLVMEYLEGETLEEVLKRRGKLPPAEAARIAYQALQGLQHLHEHGVVHRDLKPANLMLVPLPPPGQDHTLDATVKILDVGLGRALFDENDPWGTEENFKLTTDGAILGDPDYMAPEQAKDAHGADIRADIYSLGATLFHALAGHPPFPDANRLRQMIRHASEAPRPIRDLNPAVSEGLQAALNRMLAKDPAQRPSTPREAAQALEPFFAVEGRSAQPGISAVQSYLEYVEREPTTRDPNSGKVPTAASIHTWGSLCMKLPDEDAGSPVYGLEGDRPHPRPARKIWAAPRPELLPSVKEAASASPKLQPKPSRSDPQAPPPRRVETPPSLPPDSKPPVTAAQSEKQDARKAMARPVKAPLPRQPQPAEDEEEQAARGGRRGRGIRKPIPLADADDQLDDSEAESQALEIGRPESSAAAANDREEPEVENEESGMSRRDLRLLVLGVVVGAGAILLAGGLGLLLAQALK